MLIKLLIMDPFVPKLLHIEKQATLDVVLIEMRFSILVSVTTKVPNLHFTRRQMEHLLMVLES